MYIANYNFCASAFAGECLMRCIDDFRQAVHLTATALRLQHRRRVHTVCLSRKDNFNEIFQKCKYKQKHHKHHTCSDGYNTHQISNEFNWKTSPERQAHGKAVKRTQHGVFFFPKNRDIKNLLDKNNKV